MLTRDAGAMPPLEYIHVHTVVVVVGHRRSPVVVGRRIVASRREVTVFVSSQVSASAESRGEHTVARERGKVAIEVAHDARHVHLVGR